MNYPIFLQIRNKRCLVVGGGRVATRRALALRRAGAKTVVVSPTISDELRQMAEASDVEYIHGRYAAAHLDGVCLVLAATDDAVVNETVCRDARERGILVNRADKADESDFHLPSSISVGQIEIALSTSGTSPATAKALREALESDLADGGNRFTTMLRSLPQALRR